jgi:hypothetical protein
MVTGGAAAKAAPTAGTGAFHVMRINLEVFIIPRPMPAV